MDTPSHQEATLTRTINLLDAEIAQQREVLELLLQAREVLQTRVVPVDNSPRMTRAEVLEYLEISNSSLDRYIRGHIPKGKPTFPHPVGKIGHKALFKRADIVTWKETYYHTPRKG
jgi:predicted DNA-binding transcriptional regulator AlpA